MIEITYILTKEKHSWNIQSQHTKDLVVKGNTKKEAMAKIFSFDSSTNSGTYCLLDENGNLIKKRLFHNKFESNKIKKYNP